MTQEEVDLIYAYLHENYEYLDGNLIRKKDTFRYKKGHQLGCIHTSLQKGRLKIKCRLGIKGKVHSLLLSHLIFLYHHKVKPDFIKFLDQNPTNSKIENLQECCLHKTHHPKNYNKKNKGYTEKILHGKKMFVPIFSHKRKSLVLDYYEKKEQAYEAYLYAKLLKSTEDLNILEIYEKVHGKYPGIPPQRRTTRILPRGVSACGKKFLSQIYKNGKNQRLGLFYTPEKAHEAYLKAKKEYENE